MSDEQRRWPGSIAGRMQRGFHHGQLVFLLSVALLAGCRGLPLIASKNLTGFRVVSTFSDGLALVQHATSSQYGFTDREGRLVIPARFPDAQPFTRGLAAVKVGDWRGLYGYIDTTGDLAIPAQFESALPFSENLAAVRVGGRWGYIDRSGRMTIAPQFDRAFAFSNGRARVVQQGMAGFIDSEGRVIAKPAYFKAGDFREGLALACTQSRCGFLGLDGTIALPFDYEDAGSFSTGFAPVRAQGKWGYVDPKGTWLVAPRFSIAHEFSDDVALVGTASKDPPDRGYGGFAGRTLVYGYLDRRGKYLIEPSILQAESFSDGLARIRVPSIGICSDCYDTTYIRKDGSRLARYASGRDFHEGFAIVRGGLDPDRGFIIDDSGRAVLGFDNAWFDDPTSRAAAPGAIRYGYIDAAGTIVLPHTFIEAQPFSEGLALVSIMPRRSGFIDRTGAWQIDSPRQSTRVEPFSSGLALVSLREGVAYMNRKGDIEFEVPHQEGRGFSEGLAAVRVKGAAVNEWGYVDARGRLVIPPAFSEAGPFRNGRAIVTYVKDGYNHAGAIDTSGKVVERLDFHTRRPAGAPPPTSDIPNKGFFDEVHPFAEDRALVMVNGMYGYVDRQGRLVVAPKFVRGGPFREGLAVVGIEVDPRLAR